MSSILKIENLNYKNILNDLNLTLKDKKINILVGSNSSGKTTLVKAILNLINYTGSIIFMDELIDKKNKKGFIKNIGVISDFSELISDNVFENLLTPLINLDIDIDSAKQMIYQLSKKLDIEDLLFKNTNELSYLEKKMVLLSKSVLNEPKLIIIDDSLEVLDSYYRNKFLNYIQSLKKSTILFITNDSKYFYLAHNIFFIKNGKIIHELNKKNMFDDEKLYLKNGSTLPFEVELSNKLKSYDLVDDIYVDFSELVNKIWK